MSGTEYATAIIDAPTAELAMKCRNVDAVPGHPAVAWDHTAMPAQMSRFVMSKASSELIMLRLSTTRDAKTQHSSNNAVALRMCRRQPDQTCGRQRLTAFFEHLHGHRVATRLVETGEKIRHDVH